MAPAFPRTETKHMGISTIIGTAIGLAVGTAAGVCLASRGLYTEADLRAHAKKAQEKWKNRNQPGSRAGEAKASP